MRRWLGPQYIRDEFSGPNKFQSNFVAEFWDFWAKDWISGKRHNIVLRNEGGGSKAVKSFFKNPSKFGGVP